MHELLENQILHLLQKDGTPRKLVHLERELGVHGDLRPVFRAALDALCAEGRVIVDSRNQVKLPSPTGEVAGVFRANPRGYGFVTPEQITVEGEVFIAAKSTGSAMTGDRVVARILPRTSRQDPGRINGEVVRVLDRAHSVVVGTLRQEQDGWRLRPDGGDFVRPVELEGVDTREAHHGDKVAVRIVSYPTRSLPARGVITEVLGRPGRPGAETAAILKRYHLSDTFDPSAMVEAVNAKADFDPKRTRDREDLTDALVVTIDPPDAQDFDDAISLTRTGQGGWVLGVHIADVSWFVPANSALDRCARQRGNSVYLPGRTLPMLPEILSNGICSLQPDQLRYAKSVFLTCDKDGQVQSTRFANTLIKSSACLTYQQVDAALRGAAGELPEDVMALLRDMEALARRIEERRRRAGMLQLKMPATELLCNASGQVVGVQPEDTSYPHTIIEMFMVEANVAVASLLDRYCVPFMRRIHPEPDTKALRRLSQTLRLLGVTLSRRPQRSDFQALLEEVRDTRIGLPVNLLVLRSLEKAVYSPANVGHYALAAARYCHFTSPIRRYADLMVHRALQAYLIGQLDLARRQYTFGDLATIGEHISQTEQEAEQAEQALKTVLVLHLLHKRVGDELDGVVVTLTAYGASIHLPDYGIEGLIPREALGPDHWQFDEQNQCLVGRHTRAVLRLAQPLRVRVIAVHAAAGQLDLAPAKDLVPEVTPRTKRQKARRGRPAQRRRTRKRRKPTGGQ